MEESQFKQLVLDAIAKCDSCNMHEWWIADAIRLCNNNKGGDRNGSHHRLCLHIILELAMDMHSHNRSASYPARW
jgi:hypothetical protein